MAYTGVCRAGVSKPPRKRQPESQRAGRDRRVASGSTKSEAAGEAEAEAVWQNRSTKNKSRCWPVAEAWVTGRILNLRKGGKQRGGELQLSNCGTTVSRDRHCFLTTRRRGRRTAAVTASRWHCWISFAFLPRKHLQMAVYTRPGPRRYARCPVWMGLSAGKAAPQKDGNMGRHRRAFLAPLVQESAEASTW